MEPEIDHYESVIADLEAKCAQITQVVEALKQLRSMGVPSAIGSASVSIQRNASEQHIGHDTFFQMTVPDAAKKYLTMVKRTKPIAEIIETLLRGGLKSSAKDVNNSIRSMISRDDMFVRVNNEWGLAEWYPAMRREGRKGRIQPTGRADEPQSESRSPLEAQSDVRPITSTEPPMRERILTVLREVGHGPVTANLLADRTGLPLESLRARLSVMVKDGEVERVETGQYKLATRLSISGLDHDLVLQA